MKQLLVLVPAIALTSCAARQSPESTRVETAASPPIQVRFLVGQVASFTRETSSSIEDIICARPELVDATPLRDGIRFFGKQAGDTVCSYRIGEFAHFVALEIVAPSES